MKQLLAVGIILLFLSQTVRAQEEVKPSVFLLAFDIAPSLIAIQEGLLDVLRSYGFINPEDRYPLALVSNPKSWPDNSPIRFNRLDVNHEIDLVRGMIAAALDHQPNVLVTVSTPVTLAALQATSDLEEPPAIFFADVYSLHESGIADADCIKPPYVTGEESINNYGQIVDLLLLQDANMKTIGTIHNSSDSAGAYGARQIAELGVERGLSVEQSAVTSLADLALATDGLISKGVEAILLPFDDTMIAGLPIVVITANDAGIPVFYSSMDGIMRGATVAAGFYQHYEQGKRIGTMVAAYLNGELDIAATGVSRQTADVMGVAVNTVAADQLNLDLSDSLQERADFAITQTDSQQSDASRTVNIADAQALMKPVSALGTSTMQQIVAGAPTPLEAREEMDRAFLDSLACTPERIAEQQAELDAIEG